MHVFRFGGSFCSKEKELILRLSLKKYNYHHILKISQISAWNIFLFKKEGVSAQTFQKNINNKSNTKKARMDNLK